MQLRCFLDFMFFVINYFVFITHNSKLLGPTAEVCLDLFLVFFSIFNFLIFE